MYIGLGLDHGLQLSRPEQRAVVQEAAQLGYTHVFTNQSAVGQDAFQICAQWWAASAEVTDGGVTTGISVVPAPVWTALPLASVAGSVADFTGGRFILGIGSGMIYSPNFRKSYGLPERPAIGVMRDYLLTLRALLAGEKVTHDGPAVSLNNVQLAFKPPHTPVFLAAMGPQMLHLAGEYADGVALNWCSAEQAAWSRTLIAEGAARTGRSGADVQVLSYVRICVDDDVDLARRQLAKATLGYALARPGTSKTHGYRGHFARMGFDEALTKLEAQREDGVSVDKLADAFPTDLLTQVGYFGQASGAAAAFQRMAAPLDIAIVRVAPARPGVESVRAVMRSCSTALQTA